MSKKSKLESVNEYIYANFSPLTLITFSVGFTVAIVSVAPLLKTQWNRTMMTLEHETHQINDKDDDSQCSSPSRLPSTIKPTTPKSYPSFDGEVKKSLSERRGVKHHLDLENIRKNSLKRRVKTPECCEPLSPMNTLNEEVFTIFMYNDVYRETPNWNGIGGLAEMASLITRQTSKLKRNQYFVALTGDFLSASPLSARFAGKNMIDILNETPLDYCVPGNHEFDFNAIAFQKAVEQSNFQWVCANIVYKKSGKIVNGCIPTVSIKTECFKIGVFGVCTADTHWLSAPNKDVPEDEQLDFLDVVKISRECVSKLKKENCDVIIAMTHLSVAQDRHLAKSVKGINVIIGGHDHSIHCQEQGETLIIKAGCNAQYLARIKLDMQRKEMTVNDEIISRVKCYPDFILICNRNEPFPSYPVQKVIEKYKQYLPPDNDEVVGIVDSTLSSSTESVRSKETTFSNFVADALKDSFEADLVIINGGTVRGDRHYDVGYRLTKGDLRIETPFPQGCKNILLHGKDLLLAIEQGLSTAEQTLGSFPHFSRGTEIIYDVQLPPMNRIVKATLNGIPIEDEEIYVVCTTVYLATGGDNYSALKNHEPSYHTKEKMILSELLIKYVSKTMIIKSEKEGRLFQVGKKARFIT